MEQGRPGRPTTPPSSNIAALHYSSSKKAAVAKGDGSTATEHTIKGSVCDNESHSSSRRRMEVIFPEDILYQIHAFMPMRDAARASLVSREFLHSWGSYPNLIFHTTTLGINEDAHNIDEVTSAFISRVDHIMQNHSGTGVKTFRLLTYPCDNVHPSYVDRWLQIATTPGIEEFELVMPWQNSIEYNFPCSLLSTQRGSSMQSFSLYQCAFHPAAEVGCLSRLTSVCLGSVRITGEELCGFLSKSLALERLDLSNCSDIVHLKIPSALFKLNFLRVRGCLMLDMIESNPPNLSYFRYEGCPISHISLGNPLQLRHVNVGSTTKPNMIKFATILPSIAPNVQTLFLSSSREMFNTPMVFGKFSYLKYLDVMLVRPSLAPDYDFCSLVSFLDGSPALETFILHIELPAVRHDSVLENSDGNSFHPRHLSRNSHENLKNVTITGFCSAKSMIELTIHILENATSLECLTLDTSRGHERKIFQSSMCMEMFEEDLVEVRRACLAIAQYVAGNVPPTVNMKVIEPCSECLYKCKLVYNPLNYKTSHPTP